MIIIRTVRDMQAAAGDWKRAGKRIGLVPTMGFLHAGHVSLMHIAREHADAVVVSIFVNPTQFGPSEDLARYPRDFARDERLCREAGVDAIFYPDAAGMYPPDFSTWVTEERLSRPLCGATRPGHFRGVTTVVAKLFHAALPDVAVFGRKDAQQALVIQRMVRDLDFPVAIVVAPIVREADGLALSSRNVYLSLDERQRALAISRGLRAAEAAYGAGERDAAALCALMTREVAATADRIDYVELRSRETLELATVVTGPAVLAVAAMYGRTRLIDNAFLG